MKRIAPNICLNDQGWYTVIKIVDGVRHTKDFATVESAWEWVLSLVAKTRSRRISHSIYLGERGTFTVKYVPRKDSKPIISSGIRTYNEALAVVSAIQDSLNK